MPTNHHHGMLQEFAYIKQNFIRLALMEIIPNFVDTEFASESSVFWKIATTYNALQDEDFVFSGSGINESVTFPSGFETPEGEPILLLCKRNKNNAQPWVSDQLVIGEKKIASIFNVFHFNWYDVEQSVAEMIPEANRTAKDIVRSMEIRYLNAPQDLVYLQNGVVCSAEEADELYVPIGINMPTGEEIYLLCHKRNGKMGYGWYFYSATHANASFKVFDKKLWLEKWSGPLDNDVLRELANQTMQERWSFGTKENFGILRSYLQYTFSHQAQTNKILLDIGKFLQHTMMMIGGHEVFLRCGLLGRSVTFPVGRLFRRPSGRLFRRLYQHNIFGINPTAEVRFHQIKFHFRKTGNVRKGKALVCPISQIKTIRSSIFSTYFAKKYELSIFIRFNFLDDAAHNLLLCYLKSVNNLIIHDFGKGEGRCATAEFRSDLHRKWASQRAIGPKQIMDMMPK